MNKIPEKFIRALEIIDLKPSENILEIGCGAGILATLIAGDLKAGKITAIDKSKSMTSRAAQHLSAYIGAGRAEVLAKNFADYDAKEKFDKIVAFSVNFFWKDSEREFEVLRSLMHKRCSLYVFYDAPGKIKPSLIEQIKSNLVGSSFEISEVMNLKEDGSLCCIKAVLEAEP